LDFWGAFSRAEMAERGIKRNMHLDTRSRGGGCSEFCPWNYKAYYYSITICSGTTSGTGREKSCQFNCLTILHAYVANSIYSDSKSYLSCTVPFSSLVAALRLEEVGGGNIRGNREASSCILRNPRKGGVRGEGVGHCAQNVRWE
jgi:hypothetical protein